MSSISRDWNVKIAPHVEVLVYVTLGHQRLFAPGCWLFVSTGSASVLTLLP